LLLAYSLFLLIKPKQGIAPAFLLPKRFLVGCGLGFLLFGFILFGSKQLAYYQNYSTARSTYVIQYSTPFYRQATLLWPNVSYSKFFQHFWHRPLKWADADSEKNFHILGGEETAMGSRLSRWQYAIDVFSRYSIDKKLFGNGFSFVTDFSAHFKTKQLFGVDHDHPHNGLLGTLLAGGLLAATAFLVQIGICIRLFLRNIGLLFPFAFLFGLCMAFSFTSDFSFFSVPLFTLLCFVPLIYENATKNVLCVE
jgi:hypothetical protein